MNATTQNLTVIKRVCETKSANSGSHTRLLTFATTTSLLIILTMGTMPVGASTIIGDNITTSGSIYSNTSINSTYILSIIGFKDLNKTIWKEKLNYSAELAKVILQEQNNTAIALINSTKTESLTHKGESLYTKQQRVINGASVARNLIESNKIIAVSTINEARKLALLNIITPTDLEEMIIEAQNQSDILNATANTSSHLINDTLNASLVEIANNYSGLQTSNFTTTSYITTNASVYLQIISLPLYSPNPTIITCDIITNASAASVGIQFWSNVSNSTSVNQYIEYFVGASNIDSNWTTSANFNVLPLASAGLPYHITHLNIYTNQTSEGMYTLSMKSEVEGSGVMVRPPSYCVKNEY